VRKYVFKRRGILTSDAQRSPWCKLSSTAMQEIDYLLARVARHDNRAALKAELTAL
jgi:4-hydroxy-tetrahydrodipicolinate synthase